MNAVLRLLFAAGDPPMNAAASAAASMTAASTSNPIPPAIRAGG